MRPPVPAVARAPTRRGMRRGVRGRSAGAVGALVLAAVMAAALIVGGPGAPVAESARAALSGMPWWRASEVAAITALGLHGLGPPPVDPTNRASGDPRAAALGERLFADPRLSATGAVACATCHQPSKGFQDGVALATGVGTGARRTMSVVGAAYAPWLFWDGRADSPWAQAVGPLERREEHGGTRALYVRVLATSYRREYEALFGPLPSLAGVPRDAGPFGTAAERRAWAALPPARRDSVTRAFVHLGKSIAAYERTLGYAPTRLDRYAAALAAGRRPRAGEILSADEAAGLRLFVGKAECATCHGGPRLTDDGFHNTGVPAVSGLPADDGRIAGVDAALADPFNCLGPYSDAPRDAAGRVAPAACGELRFAARGRSALLRAYRAPSLRGVAARAPYMHAGQVRTLRAVLAHYNAAPRAPRGVSELHPLGLTPRELARLEAFLRALGPDAAPEAVRVAGRRRGAARGPS